MSKFFSHFIKPPPLADPEQARLARLLYPLLLMGIPIAFSFVIFDSELHAGDASWGDWVAVAAGLMLLPLLFLLRRGYVWLVSLLLILTSFGAISIASFANIGLRNPAMQIVPLVLLICSVLLGSRSATLFAVSTAALAIALYLREQYGTPYPQPLRPDFEYLMVIIILIGVATLLLHFTINQIVQGAAQIRQQADELHSKNQRLEQIQGMLEARTQQLSQLNSELQQEMNERARTEAALRQKQKLESVGLLAGGVAHDFNNLLFGILGQSALALRQLPAEQTARQHIEKAVQSAERAADLTRQLLAYAGKARFQIEPLDLNQLIQANSGLLETVVQRNSRLQLHLQPQLPTVNSDRGQLQQVLMNLVINASEAITHAQGQIVIKTAAITLTDDQDPTAFVGDLPNPGAYVRLEVSDNGCGIEHEVLEKIFDPFFSTKERGHGLGLSVVLGVVQALRGGLQVQSQLQKGSTFCVYLPANPEQAAAEETIEVAAILPPSAQLVLVIDDEAPVREAAAEMLTGMGYRTLTASNGYEGFALFHQRQGEIDAVLLDVVMPGMNGPETLEKIRLLNKRVKVILSSGYTATALPDALLQQPATSFLAKPYSWEQLLKAMALPG